MYSISTASAIKTVRRSASTVAVLGVCATAITACDKSVTAPTPASPATLIAGIVAQVYVPTFDSIAMRGAALSASLQALAATPNNTTLLAARAAWRATRVQYERNEGFAFGPLITAEIDPAIDSWPIDRSGIDALLSGTSELSVANIDALDGTLKGFHGIEYILFGDGSAVQASSLTARELAYLAAAGQSLSAETTRLQTAWSPTGGNYAGALTTAGSSSSVYGTMGAALQEIINGLVGPTEEVANSKIALPLQAGDTQYEESAFSDNTLADLQNDLGGAYAVYVGGYGTSVPVGGGISAFISAQDVALDSVVRAQFADAFYGARGDPANLRYGVTHKSRAVANRAAKNSHAQSNTDGAGASARWCIGR